MSKQVIIALGRECGSGGRVIAEIVGEKLGIDVLDKNVLNEVSETSNIDVRSLKKYDERARILGRILKSKGTEVTNAIWDLLKQKADNGESFLIVGRCAEEALKDNPNLLSVFITGERYDKFARVVDGYGYTESEAEELRRNTDADRRKFHDMHSDKKWGEVESYDVVLNSSTLGIEGTAEAILKMVEVKANAEPPKALTEEEEQRRELYFRRVQAGF